MRAELDSYERDMGVRGSRTGWQLRVAASMMALLVVIACGGPDGPTAPTISFFTASPEVVESGDSSTLTWQVAGATSLTLSPGGVDVTGYTSWVVSPEVTTTYTLRARNGSGEGVPRQVAVVVQGDAPVISSLTAEPEEIEAGGSSVLSWVVSGATSLTLSPGGVDVTGETSWEVSPEVTTTYTLLAENSAGEDSREVTVLVGAPPVIESLSFASGSGIVNPGLSTVLSWSVVDADSVSIEGPGLPVEFVELVGSMAVTPPTLGATYILRAANGGIVREASFVASRDVPAFSVLIGGQSNAKGINVSAAEALAFIAAEPGVQMLGNDYVWKDAYEPTGDCVGHVDLVSADPVGGCAEFGQNNSGVSPGVSLANGVAAATGGEVFVVPAAKHGSALNGSDANDNWQPGGDPFDTGTLFGSAANRARLSGVERGAPVGYAFDGAAFGAVLWYQGTSDTTSTSRTNAYFELTDNVLQGFEQVLGAPVILVQLSSRGDDSAVARNLLYQRVREVQRRMAEGARTVGGGFASEARVGRHLVVTHDLPMSDIRHLSAGGQVELGRRVSLAVREHLLGEQGVDGTGPRLLGVVKSSSTVVRVVFDRSVTASASTGSGAYSGYFAAFAGGDEVDILEIVRDASDSRIVRITLAEAVAGDVEVRYMPPAGAPSGLRLDVVRSESCADPMPGTGACLPVPAFGVATSAATASALRLMVFDDDED